MKGGWQDLWGFGFAKSEHILWQGLDQFGVTDNSDNALKSFPNFQPPLLSCWLKPVVSKLEITLRPKKLLLILSSMYNSAVSLLQSLPDLGIL